ncbi:MAG: tape measure protein [Acidovorax sp.]|uniref:tape measure protein n=1 Tax=Acidovorax sp. TaxID=1872122 RepID=UPI0025C6146A|nr:tape measure protein [Acidovorax sp.]MCE1193314.1 tape measure protein [Acidovorax sp.]
MADPKIKYDIEAAVKGEADADALAKTLRGVGDVLEGDLQKGALDAARALEVLGTKQRTLENFQQLKNESGALAIELAEAQGNLRQMDAQLAQASASTQRFVQAEMGAKAALETKRSELAAVKKGYEELQSSTLGAARKTDEYRTASTTAKERIQQLSVEIKQQARSLKEAEANTRTALQAENRLSAQHQESAAALLRARSAQDANNAALGIGRESLQAMGVEATNLAQAERNLQAALAQVRQEVAAMAPAYQQAATASTQSTQVQAQNQRTLREGMTSISTQLARIQQVATVALGGSYVGGLAKSVAETADEFRNLEARVKLATGEGPLFAEAFAGVQRVALATNSALDETGTLFTRLAKAGQEAGQTAEVAQNNALRLTQTINQAIQLSGGSAESSRAAITQLIQGLQSGVLRGEEFNSVMEQAPRLAQAMANGLGVTTGKLRDLAGQGALTAETVMKALRGQADVVAGEFSKLPPTVGRALQNLSTQWTLYVGQADNGMVSSANAAKVINALAGNLDTLVSTLAAVGKLWAAFKIAGLAADFGAWALKTMAATAAVEKNTLAVAANTTAQAGNAAAHAANTAAQAANIAATTASTAARTANAASWASIATFTGQATRATAAATTAAVANTAAVGAKTAAFGALGGALRGVTALFGGPVGLIATLVLFNGEIRKGISGVVEWGMKFTETGKRVKQQEEQQRKDTEATQRNAEARKAQIAAMQLQNDKMAEARNRTFDLTEQAVGLIAKFDKLRTSGDTVADAVGKIGKDFDLSNSPGIRTASGVLDKLLADGKLTATEFQAAWAKALDGQDLLKFEVLARNAFGSAAQDAKKLQDQLQQAIASGAPEAVLKDLEARIKGALSAAAREAERTGQVMDNVLREAVRRTGLEYEVLQGRVGAASRSAINDVEVIITNMGKLKAEGVDVGRVLNASIGKAIDTADSQAALTALRAQIESVRKQLGDKVADGLLDQVAAKAEELKKKLEDATGGINSVREAMERLGLQSSESLRRSADQAVRSYDVIKKAGQDEGESYLAWQRRKEEAARAMVQRLIDANRGVADSSIAARAAAEGLKLETDSAGNTIVRSMREAKSATDDLRRSAGGAAGDYQTLGRSAAEAAENIKRLRQIHDRQRLGGSDSEKSDLQNLYDRYSMDGDQSLKAIGDIRKNVSGNASINDTDINQQIIQRYGEDAVDLDKAKRAWQLRLQLQAYQTNYGNARSQQSLLEQRNIAAELDRVERELEDELLKKRKEKAAAEKGGSSRSDSEKASGRGREASGDLSGARASQPSGQGQRSSAAAGGGVPVHLHYEGQPYGVVNTDPSGRAVLQNFFKALADGKSVSGR